MKRTAELVLSVIGSIFYVLTAALFGLVFAVLNNEEILEEIEMTPQEIEDINTALDFMNAGGVILIGTAIIAMILGIVAAVMLKGNKNPKAAGIILLVVSVLASIITFGVAIFPSIFFFIAGLMALIRKDPQTVNQQF